MKKIILVLSALTLVFSFTSCSKENKPESGKKQNLTARTWQVETVTDHYSGTATVIYQRGAASNESDFSMIRQTYKNDGTIQYVDDFGESGSDATYQLLDNETKIRINYLGLSITGEDLVVTGNQFAYTIKYSATEYTRFVFSPL